VKPGPPHVPHAQSRQSLQLAIASWERILSTWREIAAQAETGNIKRLAGAEQKIAECEAELARLRGLLSLQQVK
jgi:hypothetical protein